MAYKWIAALAAGVLVAACGGGGGGGSSAPPAANLTSSPGNSAVSAFYQAANSTALSGSDSIGNTWTAHFTLTPNVGTTTFNGVTVDSATITTTDSVGGQSSTATQISYFTLNPLTAVGSVQVNGSQYEVMQSWTPLPATLAVGQSGSMGTSTTFDTVAEANIDGTNVYTYKVTALSPTALQLCLTDAFTAVPNNPDALTSLTESNCFAITSAGVASISEIVIEAGGVSVTLM